VFSSKRHIQCARMPAPEHNRGGIVKYEFQILNVVLRLLMCGERRQLQRTTGSVVSDFLQLFVHAAW
jgi:hypothetical protein